MKTPSNEYANFSKCILYFKLFKFFGGMMRQMNEGTLGTENLVGIVYYSFYVLNS